MFYIKRALVVLGLVVATFPACAFTFSYGNLLDVKEVKNKNGVLQLPLTRKKYKNVKILSKELYEFVRQCSADCRYAAGTPEWEMAEFRAVQSRQDMWIADVSVNGELLLTCLVFKNKNGLSIKFPQEVRFTDNAFKEQMRQYVEQFAAEKI